MVAEALLLFHVPPGAPSVYTVKVPTQTEAGPVTEPAKGTGLTTMVIVAIAMPHALLTV
jgi:hypothetical protein